MWFRKVWMPLPSEMNSSHSKLMPFSISLGIILWRIEDLCYREAVCSAIKAEKLMRQPCVETSWNKSHLYNFTNHEMSETFPNNLSVVRHFSLTEKPGKPYLRKKERADGIECISESYPQPSVQWMFCETPEKRYGICLHACWISSLTALKKS